MTSNDSAIVALGVARRRVNLGHDYCLAHADQAKLFEAGAAKWQRVADAYRAELKAVIEQFDREALDAARDELCDRLERGLAIVVESDDVAEQFDALLTRYEAVCDALAGYERASKQIVRMQGYAYAVAAIHNRKRQARDRRDGMFR